MWQMLTIRHLNDRRVTRVVMLVDCPAISVDVVRDVLVDKGYLVTPDLVNQLPQRDRAEVELAQTLVEMVLRGDAS